jgi:hypothetical protein
VLPVSPVLAALVLEPEAAASNASSSEGSDVIAAAALACCAAQAWLSVLELEIDVAFMGVSQTDDAGNAARFVPRSW